MFIFFSSSRYCCNRCWIRCSTFSFIPGVTEVVQVGISMLSHKTASDSSVFSASHSKRPFIFFTENSTSSKSNCACLLSWLHMLISCSINCCFCATVCFSCAITSASTLLIFSYLASYFCRYSIWHRMLSTRASSHGSGISYTSSCWPLMSRAISLPSFR